MRQFEQRARLLREMGAQHTASRAMLVERYAERAAEMDAHAEVLRRLLLEKAAA